MTNTPGDGQTPQDPSRSQPDPDQPNPAQPDPDQPGYWAQQPQQQPYGQPAYGQPAYGQAPGYPAQAPQQYAPDHPRATTALVLGILGIVLCGIIAPFAWSVGKKAVAEIDASNGAIGGRGAANAGYILGIVGTILLGISVLVVVGFLVLAVVGMATSGTTY